MEIQQSFETHGYYVLEDFMTEEEINTCETEIERLHKLGTDYKDCGMQEWGHIARPDDKSLSNREDLDTSNVVGVPLKAGSALMFRSLVVRGSGPNRSPRPRHTSLYAYLPPTVQYISKGVSDDERTFPVVSGLEGREEFTLRAGSVA